MRAPPLQVLAAAPENVLERAEEKLLQETLHAAVLSASAHAHIRTHRSLYRAHTRTHARGVCARCCAAVCAWERVCVPGEGTDARRLGVEGDAGRIRYKARLSRMHGRMSTAILLLLSTAISHACLLTAHPEHGLSVAGACPTVARLAGGRRRFFGGEGFVQG